MSDERHTNQLKNHAGWRPLLRRADQAVVAVLILFALVGMSVYWFVQGGPRGELIEIDRADPLTARYLVDINRAEWPDSSRLKLLGNLVFKAVDLPCPVFDSRATPGIDAAEKLLQGWLTDGPRHYKRILADGRKAGLAPMTFYRAKRRLGVTHSQGCWAFS